MCTMKMAIVPPAFNLVTFMALEVARSHHITPFVTDGSGHGARCSTGSTSDLRFSSRGFDPSAAPALYSDQGV